MVMSNEFRVNEEFITMLDYYVLTSLSAKSSEAQHFRTFYCMWVAMYKAERGPALQNLLLRVGCNVQGPRRTARPEKLEAGAS